MKLSEFVANTTVNTELKQKPEKEICKKLNST